jgi:minor extracellular serine protease Vpr
MRSTTFKIGTTLVLIVSVMMGLVDVFAQQQRLEYPDLATAQEVGSRDSGATAKLSSDLRILFTQFAGSSRSGSSIADLSFSEKELKELYGITDVSGDPRVGLAVTMSGSVNRETLKQRGMSVYMVQGNTAHGEAPVSSLTRLASDRAVVNIASAMSVRNPIPPASDTAPQLIPEGSKGGARSTAAPLANEFNKGTLSGKGVIVGVIDTGIDFKHPDFIRPDGTSRIIAIWDLFDNSFRDSAGRIGTSPPKVDPAGEALPGTIYTNAQINAALKGTGTVNTVDSNGHGTAVAGTAAGNGRAASGLYPGVASDADLMIVKASDCGGFSSLWHYGAAWITQSAQNMKKPVVVNGSFGGHYSAHNGNTGQEQFLNQISGKGKPGVVFTISAGNEGHYNMHASGRFGPKRPGQVDVSSRGISVNIAPEKVRSSNNRGTIMGVFDSRDEWGFAVVPSGNSPLKDTTGKPMTFFIFKTAGVVKWAPAKGLVATPDFAGYANSILTSYTPSTGGSDTILLPLPAGSYDIFGLSMSTNVVDGSFSLYAPNQSDVDFGRGTTKTGMVGSPGNAANVITVGAYDFRSTWTNKLNQQTFFNLPVGRISDYSSPGGKRRDGIVKPDIAAPATYTISPLSSGATAVACEGNNMGASGDSFVTPDGKYVAWRGTSASSPYAAGVIALMLQKNPTLDAEQVRQILIKTAGSGGEVGSVPNPNWGYGRLDPAAAIKATTAAVAGAKPAAN